MYLAYYGLKKEAFHSTPDPNFLFLSSSHKEALGAIVYGVEKRKGFIEIVGEVGVGKTTIIRAFLEEHSAPNHKAIYIFNPIVSYHGLLAAIFRELNLIPVHDDVAEMVYQLQEALIKIYKEDGTVVLIIDEAQNMPIETLENLRMLSNLETSTEKLMQVVLVGQPELETLLQKPELRQFQQRIALRAKICALTEKESRAFILHRIAVASTPGNPVFTDKALRLIARNGGGIPRQLIILCDNALITGFGRQITPVPVSVVKETLSDVKGSHSPVVWKWALVAGMILLLGLGVMILLGPLNLHLNRPMLQWGAHDKSGSFTQSTHSTINSSKDFNTVQENIHKPDLADSAVSPTQSMNDLERRHELKSSSEIVISNQSKEDGGIVASESTIDQPTIKSSRVQPKTESLLSRGVISTPNSQIHKESSEKVKRISGQSVHTTTSHKDAFAQNSMAVRPDSSQAEVMTPSSHVSVEVRFIKNGESLSRIANEVYGSTEMKYIDWVKHHNPQIVNPDVILPGQKVLLPEYRKDNKSQ
ncbi:MAG: hypothetical protein NPIRA02_40930 [Nitrospirales bacterium]|nr:MAG: hypothetical protein NPIRA02_40930 [Nitrospirales bacterium]